MAKIKLLYIMFGLSATLAQADGQKHQFNIPAQPLASALQALAKQSGGQTLYAEKTAAGKTSPAINGNYTVQEATDKLLSGIGLDYRVSGKGTVTVKPIAPKTNLQPVSDNGSDTTLPKVTVEADSAYDPEYYADPYNKDYVIPNATAGTKTDTPIMETPLNVQVISKQVLKDRQAFTFKDALKNVSGVQVVKEGFWAAIDTQSVFMRGFDSQSFFRDGFRLTAGSSSREFANVESVEVLKGPAAILYGLVEPGGMINVITKKPLATPYYGFSQQAGSFDTYRSTLDATGPIAGNKDLLYRVNLSYENSGSFRDSVGKENVFFAPVLQWNISPRTQATFELEYNRTHQGIDIGGFFPILSGHTFKPARHVNYSGYVPLTVESVFGSFNWSHQFNDDWTLKHRFSVNQKNTIAARSTFGGFAGSPMPIYGLPPGKHFLNTLFLSDPAPKFTNDTYASNLDLVGHFDTGWLKHTLLVGGDYYHLSDLSDNRGDLGRTLFTVDALNPVLPGQLFCSPELQNLLQSVFGSDSCTNWGASKFLSTTAIDQFGLYIQDQIKLPYNVHVTGGIRWQYIDQKQDFQSYNSDLSLASSSVTAQVQDAVTPRVGILWNPEKWLSLYANYTESFGANQGKAFVSRGVGKVLDPTSASQYEGGLKFEFFDGKLRGTVGYYDLTKTNVAVSDPNLSHDCGNGAGCSIAVGEVRSRGPEIDIQGEILPGWNVLANWTNIDIRATKGVPGNTFVPTGDFFAGGNVGDRLPYVPRNTGNLWSTYEVQAGDFKSVKFGGGLNFQGSTYTGDNQYPNPGFITVDLMAGYSKKIGDATISAQLNVNNLLDKYYTTSLFPGAASNYINSAFGAPRTFMGMVSVQY